MNNKNIAAKQLTEPSYKIHFNVWEFVGRGKRNGGFWG